jgi:preprotein translocase subunit SecA
VVDLGGLHILGTERHESRRIDNQLRGRSGRQGDPGSSRFYLSLEDDLLRIFGSDRIASVMGRLGMEEGEPIEHNLISRAIENAQKKVEAHNFDIRKHLLEYDDVMNTQRDIIYSMRREILSGEGIDDVVRTMMEEKVDSLIDAYTDPKADPEEWEIQGLKDQVARLFGVLLKLGPPDMGEDEFHALKPDELRETLKEEVWKVREKREMEFGKEDLKSIQKYFLLQIIDHQWVDHLQDMENMKEGIGLRGYGHLDPLREYKKEGFALFEGLMERIKDETLVTLSRIRLMKEKPKEEELPRKRARVMQFSHGGGPEKVETVRREGKKVGRNDPCPCGSGKKYKKCCGMNA